MVSSAQSSASKPFATAPSTRASALGAVIDRPPGALLGDLAAPRASRWALRGMALCLTALVAWSAVARIDQVTRAPAQLVMAARTQLVQSADGGVITQFHVKEGDAVRAGQILVTLQKERAQAAVDDSAGKVAALRITLARLQAEVYGKPLRFEPALQKYAEYVRNQSDLFNKRQTAIQQDLSSLQGLLSLAEDELAMNRKLAATGDVSRAELLRLERAAADLRAQITTKRNKYFQDAQAEMTKAQEDLNTQLEMLRDRAQVLDHTELVAPMDGVVNTIKINTLGGVVRPGDTVMELLPDSDDLIVEAKVSTSDIAFVAVAQPASVKLDAYDAAIYGALQGRVTYVSPDVLTEESRQGTQFFYRVRIAVERPALDGTSGQRAQAIKLRPGLTASVDIKANDRSVLSYLTKPITKTLLNGLGER